MSNNHLSSQKNIKIKNKQTPNEYQNITKHVDKEEK
jgi:hypothetical protein